LWWTIVVGEPDDSLRRIRDDGNDHRDDYGRQYRIDLVDEQWNNDAR